MKKSKKSRDIVEIDMRGVETRSLCPEGVHKVKVVKVTRAISESSDKPYLAWEFKTPEGHTLYYNTSLQPQALFNLKNVLLALGYDVPDAIIRLNLKELNGLEGYVEVAHETYEGKKRARIVEFLEPDNVEDDEFEDDDDLEEDQGDEGEEENGEEDDGDDEEGPDLDEMSLEELLEYAEENDIDLTHLKKKDRKKKAAVLKAIKEALEEDEGE